MLKCTYLRFAGHRCCYPTAKCIPSIALLTYNDLVSTTGSKTADRRRRRCTAGDFSATPLPAYRHTHNHVPTYNLSACFVWAGIMSCLLLCRHTESVCSLCRDLSCSDGSVYPVIDRYMFELSLRCAADCVWLSPNSAYTICCGLAVGVSYTKDGK